MRSGSHPESVEMVSQAQAESADMIRMIEIRWHGTNGGLPAHGLQRIIGGIERGRRRARAILRIERKQQNPVAARRFQRLDAFAKRRKPIAHAPIDDDFRHVAQRDCGFLGLCTGDRLERQLVAFPVPYLCIGMTAARRTYSQDDAIQDHPPQRTIGFDDPSVRQELLEIAAHGPVIGRFRRPEIDQQYADLADDDGRVTLRPVPGIGFGPGFGHVLASPPGLADVTLRLGQN